jgi:hypothetical protein
MHRRLVIFFLLGLALSVLAAGYQPALSHLLPDRTSTGVLSETADWYVFVDSEVGATTVTLYPASFFNSATPDASAPHVASVPYWVPFRQAPPYMLASVTARGWPFRAFHYTSDVNYFTPDARSFICNVSGGIIVDTPHRRTIIPFRPIWPGLIANTLILGMSVWAIAFTVSAARRITRRNEHLCSCCGYCLRTLARCPECGAPAERVA